MMTHALTDRTLAQRLERTEAVANAGFVEARAARHPESGAAWRDVGGTYAMFDGPGSPITQTFGLGLFADCTPAQLDEIEGFYASHDVHDPCHEVSPLADPALLIMLPARGYRPMELSAVLHRPVAAPIPGGHDASSVSVRRMAVGEEEQWADTSAAGWSGSPDIVDFIRGFALLSALSRATINFVGELDGSPVATGSMVVHEGVALLAGASTIEAARRRGAQGALLAARLAHAAALGCDTAMMAALPGSTSQLNAERQGFYIAYTRIKWMRHRAGAGAP